MARFSETVMEHVQDPHHRGVLPEATHAGTVGEPGRGAYFVLQLRVQDKRVMAASFQCNACGVTIACGSLLTEWLQDRSVTECVSFTAADLIDLAGGLPPDKQHCPHLAITALRAALSSSSPVPGGFS